MPRRVTGAGIGGRKTGSAYGKVSGKAPSSFFKGPKAPKLSVKVYGVEKAISAFNKVITNVESSTYKAFVGVLKLLEYEIKRVIRVGKYKAFDTGFMHDHVKWMVEKRFIDYLKGSVGVYGVNYAVYVHEGTRYMLGRAFLLIAIYRKHLLMEKMLREAIAKDIAKGLI